MEQLGLIVLVLILASVLFLRIWFTAIVVTLLIAIVALDISNWIAADGTLTQHSPPDKEGYSIPIKPSLIYILFWQPTLINLILEIGPIGSLVLCKIDKWRLSNPTTSILIGLFCGAITWSGNSDHWG
ncbi:hypothetical protein [Cognatiyoonia sp. IB215182]|uniref:hypothetical protein n=1 Tax=Cognatiyoonia sp. IB215182 TaxID=3097353 RepID=UPI002A146BF7|nr:hypothetical protein [Cognatiyoonia sp. IB215182]MDX8354736.1 hypothetical protein [Cognatiyoonia sp. IB215182]